MRFYTAYICGDLYGEHSHSYNRTLEVSEHSKSSFFAGNKLPSNLEQIQLIRFLCIHVQQHIRLSRRSWDIVVRKFYVILLNAENECSNEAFVAGITTNSFMTLHTAEIASAG